MCFVDAPRFVAVGPCHDDVRAMAFSQAIPLLTAEDVEVQRVEGLEMLLDRRCLPFASRRRRFRLLGRRLRRGSDTDKREGNGCSAGNLLNDHVRSLMRGPIVIGPSKRINATLRYYPSQITGQSSRESVFATTEAGWY